MIELTASPDILSFDIEVAKAWLQERLSQERYLHSLGAHDKAVELAERFHFSPEDCQRGAVAGLLHDAAKLLSPPELIGYCERHHLPLSQEDKETPQVLHPRVGAHMVEKEFNLTDSSILNAIRFHTTGRAGMDRVEKIVYIADKIEGNTRNPLFIKKMTEKLDFSKPETLDLTMLFILNSTISFLMEKHQVIHVQTIEARNDFISQLKQMD